MKIRPKMAILYPGGPPMFADFWSGRANRVIVSLETSFIPAVRLPGDTGNDPAFPNEFQAGIVLIGLS